MNKEQAKIAIIFLILSVIVSTIAFAGNMIQLYCEKCGFKSTAVAEGVGVSGIENTIVYCKAYKDFYSIPTKVVFKTELGKDVQIVKSICKKEFLGEERLIFPCPKCGNEAFAYRGHTCPTCEKEELKSLTVGLWD